MFLFYLRFTQSPLLIFSWFSLLMKFCELLEDTRDTLVVLMLPLGVDLYGLDGLLYALSGLVELLGMSLHEACQLERHNKIYLKLEIILIGLWK